MTVPQVQEATAALRGISFEYDAKWISEIASAEGFTTAIT